MTTNNSEKLRRSTTFLLALFLWAHAALFVDPHSAIISKCAQWLHLTTSEVVIFVVLFIFSIVTGSGIWKAIRSLTYIYTFPFVLLGHACYACFLGLRAVNRWFISQANFGTKDIDIAIQHESKQLPTGGALVVHSDSAGEPKKRLREVLRVLFLPFRKATFLWCFLLLVSTHIGVLWLGLIVVVVHLARKIFAAVKIALFSGPLMTKAALNIKNTIYTALTTLTLITHDSAPTPELTNLRNQLRVIEPAARFLSNRDLVVRWAWLIAALFLGGVYVYMALLFSFAYYGIARVSGVAYSWPEAFVTSLFIPLFAGDLPRLLGAKLLGGIQFILILLVSFGTVYNYIYRRLDSIRAEAIAIRDRFEDQTIRERYLILQKMVDVPTKKSNVIPSTG